MKRKLKKSVIYSLYGLSFTFLLSGVVLLGFAAKEATKQTYEYVSKSIFDYEEDIKVVSTGEVILRPYVGENIKIVKDYYDYKAEAESQEKSLIYYENTYIQSSGVSYSNGDTFNVVSILEGTVKDVKEDVMLGNSIMIEHSNGITSIYQSVSNILVKPGDVVNAGFVIGKSSTSNISSDLNTHLYFELIVDGKCVNPEHYYEKKVSELK